MRKIVLIVFVFLGTKTCFGWTKIEKYNGGFFGYKLVTESHSGPNHMLACADPGKKSCSWAGLVVSTDGEVKEEQLKEIDDIINKNVLSERFEGTFYYGSNFYVHYSYDLDSDRLNYEVYNLKEAHELGFI